MARRRDARFVPRSPAMPCDWRPWEVLRPETGMFFTDIGAWHFIAELAEAGHLMEEIILDKPRGERGYVMIVEFGPCVPDLYIKVQIKGGKIFGRSFHYSTGRSL